MLLSLILSACFCTIGYILPQNTFPCKEIVLYLLPSIITDTKFDLIYFFVLIWSKKKQNSIYFKLSSVLRCIYRSSITISTFGVSFSVVGFDHSYYGALLFLFNSDTSNLWFYSRDPPLANKDKFYLLFSVGSCFFSFLTAIVCCIILKDLLFFFRNLTSTRIIFCWVCAPKH